MKDYLLIIRTEGCVWTDLSTEQLRTHMEEGGKYIVELLEKGILKNANPIEKTGSRIVSKNNDLLKDEPFNTGKELVAGFFYITTNNMEEALKITKSNPIFKDISTKIEVHPLMPIQS